MLESSDYHGKEHSFSYICCSPIATIKVEGEEIKETIKGQKDVTVAIDDNIDMPLYLSSFVSRFKEEEERDEGFFTNGFFGYITFDAVRYFEDITLHNVIDGPSGIPDIQYSMYEYVIAIDHFKNEVHLYQHGFEADTDKEDLKNLKALITRPANTSFSFDTLGDETTNLTDDEYREMVRHGKAHCMRGDVFQIVLSRKFGQGFRGDEFNVYRALRSINPSPYLFFFDYGSFKLFGSSPEAQIIIKENHAEIHPIAGTFKRTGNDAADTISAEALKEDPKENAEHVMLVDLARNDLSKNGTKVKIDTYREIQFYSHVIHLVSKVSAVISDAVNYMNLVADTFPAGTLSGAPKYKAMELIDKYESTSRGFYGGCIGHIGLNNEFNHAIMIRTFMSKDNTLHYQAGAGVVEKSVVEDELQEVNNKMGALRSALEIAKGI